VIVPRRLDKGRRKQDAKRAAKEQAEEQPLIRIDGSMGFVPMPNANADPYVFYSAYYHSQDIDRTNPEKLRKLVEDLNRLRRVRDVHAALIGYLKNHPKLAEPWMYEALALSIEINKGSAADVKKALNYAADLAQHSHNPNLLVSAADQLFLRGYYERVGPMLDEAMKAVPHALQPMLISINLAQKTKDPARMADGLDRLLSLGWPGNDDYFRIEAGNQVDKLSEALKSAERTQEGDALQAKLTASLARDLFVRLTWDGDADFDLLVDEPLGATACYETPRTVFGGAMLKNGYGSHPEEVYACPRGFSGKYAIRTRAIYTNPEKPVTRLTLESITHEGTASEKKETHSLSPDKPNKPVIVTLTGGRRKNVLPFVDPVKSILSAAPPPPKRRNRPAATPKGAAAPGGAAAKIKPLEPATRNIEAQP
jgi:hypothetical protein